jgi:hypothetical protein
MVNLLKCLKRLGASDGGHVVVRLQKIFWGWANLRDDSSNGNEDANHGFVSNGATRRDPTKSDNGACLYVAYYRA